MPKYTIKHKTNDQPTKATGFKMLKEAAVNLCLFLNENCPIVDKPVKDTDFMDNEPVTKYFVEPLKD